MTQNNILKPVNSIALISDLHLDFWLQYYRQHPEKRSAIHLLNLVYGKCQGVDLVVNAGDMTNGYVDRVPMLSVHGDATELFVPGNHDFYGFDLPNEPDMWFNDQIAATSLWTNFPRGEGMEHSIYKRISDSQWINNTSWSKVSILGKQSFDWLKMLDREIVVTHWPPSWKSMGKQYEGDTSNPYFLNDYDKWIGNEMHTKLWICGHTHHKHSYHIGDTHVVCNPLGYPGEMYKSIDDYQPLFLDKVGDEWKVRSNE